MPEKGETSQKGVLGLFMFFLTAAIIVYFSLYWFIPKLRATQVVGQDLLISLVAGIIIGAIATAAIFFEIRK